MKSDIKSLVATVCPPDDRSALAAVRSLGKEGMKVWVGGQNRFGQAFHSRFAAGHFSYPHPAAGYENFIQRLISGVRRCGIDVVLPISDYIVEALSLYRDRMFGVAAFAIPPQEALALARDKLVTLQRARSLGIRCPETDCPSSPAELKEVADRLEYPVVVKPRKTMGALGLWFASSAEELLSRYRLSTDDSDRVFDFSRPIIQQYVPGRVHDLCVLFREGEPVASLTQKRLFMYPADGGGGTLNETTWEPDLYEQGTALLKSLDWHGPAQVEFKVNESTGETWLLEINPRFWGTLDLAVQAGVDFPLLTAAVALEEPVPAPKRYQIGLRYRWPLPYGLLHAMLPGRRGEALRAFFLPQKGTLSDLRLDDPLPHVIEALSAARRIWHRRSLRPLRDIPDIPAEESADQFRGR